MLKARFTFPVLSVVLLFVLIFLPFRANADNTVLETIKLWESGCQLSQEQIDLLRAQPFYQYTGPSSRLIVGPDQFGYVARDMNAPGGPQVNWIDIIATGQEVAAEYGLGDEDVVGPFPIDEGFPFYGIVRDQFWVQSNGLISFFPEHVLPNNQPMPMALYGAMIAWFWDDLDPDNGNSGGRIYYETRLVEDEQALVISFHDIDRYPDAPNQRTITAQLILFTSGRILLQIQNIDIGFDPAESTIGIQNDDGNSGVLLLHNGQPSDLIHSEYAVEFIQLPPVSWLNGFVGTLNPGPATISGATVEVQGRAAVTGPDGFFSVDSLVPAVEVPVSITAGGYYSHTQNVDLAPGVNTGTYALRPYDPPMMQSFLAPFDQNDGSLSPEEGDTTWVHEIPTVYPLEPASSPMCWMTGAEVLYPANARSRLMTDRSWLIRGAGAKVYYQHWYAVEPGWDGYNFQISLDGGSTWSVLEPQGGYTDPDGVAVNGWQPCFNGHTNRFWLPVVYDLSDYVGEQVWFSFYLASDPIIQWPGVAIDDFCVIVKNPQYPRFIYTELTEDTLFATGGPVSIQTAVVNFADSPVEVDVWSLVRFPSGSLFQPEPPETMVLEPGFRSWTSDPIIVPEWIPAGRTYYAVYVGQRGTLVENTGIDSFLKLPPEPIPAGVADEAENVVTESQEMFGINAYPNPFNESTTIELRLPETGEINIAVFDITGRLVTTLQHGKLKAGRHQFQFSGNELSSGVYFVKVVAPDSQPHVRKMLLVK